MQSRTASSISGFDVVDAEVSEHHPHGEGGGEGVGEVLAGERRGAAVHGLEQGAAPSGVGVGAARHAEAALERGAEVGDDVTEEVVGDDDLDVRRVLHHVEAQRVDVDVHGLDAGVVLRDLAEDARPELVGVLHRVGLVGHVHALLPLALAWSKAARMMRSTPLRVLMSSLMAISSGVPRRTWPPTLT
jgi:hypothetical protein